MARRRRLRRKMAGFFAKTRRGGAAEKMHTPPSVEFFVLPMAKRRWRTFCTSSRFNEGRAEKMSDGQRFYLS